MGKYSAFEERQWGGQRSQEGKERWEESREAVVSNKLCCGPPAHPSFWAGLGAGGLYESSKVVPGRSGAELARVWMAGVLAH